MGIAQYLAAEGNPHATYEAMYEYSSPRGFPYTPPPPVNIIYNITNNSHDTEQIKDYVMTLLDDNMSQYTDQITEKVIEKLNSQVYSDIESIINEIFSEIPLEDIDSYFEGEEES